MAQFCQARPLQFPSNRRRPPVAGARSVHAVANEELLDVVIEIPRGSRNKYEYDHERHVIRLDRRLFSATVYPADYGFVPSTLAEDGDPLDVLVLLEDPTFPGCWVEVRAVGVFWMNDEKGADAKIIAVPAHDPAYAGVRDIGDVPQRLLDEIEHFFDVYKMLEPDKQTTTRGYEGRDAASAEIRSARARYTDA
jgi:inorganic pyrophosphatase